MKGITQRQKLSKAERSLEKVGVEAAGLKIEWIPRIIVALVLALIAFVLFKLKILTWFLIVALNIAFLSYWIHVMKRTNSVDTHDGYVNDSERPATIGNTRRVSSKRIFS